MLIQYKAEIMYKYKNFGNKKVTCEIQGITLSEVFASESHEILQRVGYAVPSGAGVNTGNCSVCTPKHVTELQNNIVDAIKYLKIGDRFVKIWDKQFDAEYLSFSVKISAKEVK